MSKNDIVKSPNEISSYTEEDLTDLIRCVEDPLFFMRNFMKIQHPIRGAIPFEPFPFQERLIRGFADNRFCIALTARQMGKCVTGDTVINADGEEIEIGSLVNLSWREKIVAKLEQWMVDLAR